MDALSSPNILLFGPFRFDRSGRLLFRCTEEGHYLPVSIGSRAIAVLEALTERPGDLVSKDEIMRVAWPGLTVEEGNLTVQISTLRRILDAGSDGTSCIQTVSGRGYRFVPRVTRHEQESVALTPAAAADPIETPAGKASGQSRVRSWRRLTVGSGAVAIVVLMAAGWDGGWLTRTPVPDRRQSAIVLPFENSSLDPAQNDFAAALTRDLTDRLALGHNGSVVPAVTASTYRGKSVDLKAIGRKYDVHFALVGNVRRQAGRMILSASIYDVADGQPIWSRQFDLPDGPGALTTVVQGIYEGYWQTSVDVEANRAMRDHPGRLDKRDLMNVALSTRLATPTKEQFLEKMSLVDRVLAIDPNDFQGLERQARFHAEFVLLGYSSDPAADLAIAEKASDQLFTIDPNNLLALRARTTVLRARGDWPAAEAVVRRALELQPTEAMRHYELGSILMAEGRPHEALQSFQSARRFAGGSDPVYLFDANIAMANLASGQLAEAIAIAQASISEFPPNTGRIAEIPWLALIAATSDSGRDDEGRADLQRFLAAKRTRRTMAEIQQSPYYAANPNLLEGLRRAGMPTE